MGFSHGFEFGDRDAGLFFCVPFHEAAHRPAVPANQVYRVVVGTEGFFEHGGMPPFPNAADTPYVRYTNIETSLYPLVQQCTGGPYRVLKPFDINRYNKVLERRSIDSQLREPVAMSVAVEVKKRVFKSKTRKTKPRLPIR